MARRKKKKPRKQTDIEVLLEEILVEENIVFLREYKRGTYNVDFYIPDCKLSLQSDGEYWHKKCSSCPGKAQPTPRQKYQALKDKACISFHKRFKVSIMRFCSCELKGNKEFVRTSIVKAMDEIKKGNLVYRNRKMPENKDKK